MNNLKKVEFGEIAELRKEKFNPETSNDSKPCLELEHFEQGMGEINGFVSSSEQKSIKNVFYKGDILFGKLRPYLRKYWLAVFDGVCSSEVWVLKPKTKEISADYLFNLVQTNGFIQATNVSSGSKMPRADWDYIINYPLSIVKSLPEQHAIAHVLGLMDAAINKNNQLIAQKELQKKWLMQNLLTGKKRLNQDLQNGKKHLNQDLQNDRMDRIGSKDNSVHSVNPVNSDSDNWKEVRLGDIFERVTRKNEECNLNVVTISAQRGFIRQTDFFNKTIASEITDNYFLVERGEFCYNKSYSNGYPWGATKRLNDFDKAVVTTLYICFGLKNHKKNSGDFFEQFFEANLLDKGLTKIAHEGGRAHGLLNVTPSDFFSLKVLIPNMAEQTAIAKVLQAADKELQLLKSKTEKLREQKKGMMQVLLTGKKRLKVSESGFTERKNLQNT
ncbi:MAG: restriction endonuclease subunit S [Mariniphaga sp.]